MKDSGKGHNIGRAVARTVARSSLRRTLLIWKSTEEDSVSYAANVISWCLSPQGHLVLNCRAPAKCVSISLIAIDDVIFKYRSEA